LSFRYVQLEVSEVFVIGGTTPHVSVGKSGSADTDNLAFPTEAQLEAVGTYAYTAAGVFAPGTPLAADTTVVIALEGDTTITSAGRAKVVIPLRTL
jgi:hypothetical protein